MAAGRKLHRRQAQNDPVRTFVSNTQGCCLRITSLEFSTSFFDSLTNQLSADLRQRYVTWAFDNVLQTQNSCVAPLPLGSAQ